HHLANEGMRLYPTTFPHHGAALDLNKRADEVVVANDAAIEIDRLHDGDPFTERDVHHSGMLDFWFSHKLLNRQGWRHRSLCAFQYGNHVPGVLDAGQGNALVANAIQVVFRLCPKRLDKLYLRQKYIPATMIEFRGLWLVKIHVLTQDGFAIDSLVINGNLIIGNIVINYHFAGPDNDHFTDFLRIQPTDMNIGHDFPGINNAQENHVIHLFLHIVHTLPDD